MFPLLKLMPTLRVTLLASCLWAPLSSHAAPVIYVLGNLPEATVASPDHGLRLDALFEGPRTHNHWTFDFEAEGASVTLVYDDANTPSLTDDTVRISGTVMGGLDTGDAFGDMSRFGAWQLDFSYSDNFVQGGEDIRVGQGDANLGSITPLFAVGGDESTRGVPIALAAFDSDERRSKPSFRFVGEDGAFTGGGLLRHRDKAKGAGVSEWVFTGTVIPEPTTGALLALGLLGLAAAARR